ncbi:MAG: threonine/serine exporter family protein [Firmicutes bacterium]|nr:threonine/serine exporter family protein [Bacillota bacterium]
MEDLVEIVLLAGEVLLTNGAEIQRVEETIARMGKAAGFLSAEGFATPTGLFVSFYAPDGRVYTRVRRIRAVKNNIAKIAAVNSLSRAYASGEISTDEVKEALLELTKPEAVYFWPAILASGPGCAGFALIFDGSMLDALFAGIIGMLVALIGAWLSQYPIPRIASSAVGGTIVALCARLFCQFSAADMNKIILGAVMVLVPGVLMTTSLRDMLSGELVSGVSRGADALAIAVGVAAGVAVVLSVGV